VTSLEESRASTAHRPDRVIPAHPTDANSGIHKRESHHRLCWKNEKNKGRKEKRRKERNKEEKQNKRKNRKMK
jgi:hypothetical protein